MSMRGECSFVIAEMGFRDVFEQRGFAHAASALHPEATPLPWRGNGFGTRLKTAFGGGEWHRQEWARFLRASTNALEIKIKYPELGQRDVTNRNRGNAQNPCAPTVVGGEPPRPG